MNMSAKDSLRAWIAGIAWIVGIVVYAFTIVTANNGDSVFPIKTTIVIALVAGIPQGIGFALTIGYRAAGGGLSAIIWAIAISSSAYLALNRSIAVAIVDLVVWAFLMILAQLFSNKSNA